MTTLTMSVGDLGHKALLTDASAADALREWLRHCPEPLRSDCVRLVLLNEAGTSFLASHLVRGADGKLILGAAGCPDKGIHLVGHRCLACESRHMQAETVIETPPLPLSVLRYFTPTTTED